VDLDLNRPGPIGLPSGRLLDLHRPRSAGPLDMEELAFCREQGVPLAYDPVGVGWVSATCEDDLDLVDEASPAGGPAPAMEFGGRYRLRPWRLDDAPRFVALLDNPRVWEYLPESYPAPLTEDLARDLIELSNRSDHHEVLALELDGEVVGQVRLAFNPGSEDRSEGEISYWLGEPWWGQGIGRDLVAHFTALSFGRHPELRSIVARVHEHNTASGRILEGIGYAQQERSAASPAICVYRSLRAAAGIGSGS
jgi:RimJ/RimL family protein N-acetyltransferase